MNLKELQFSSKQGMSLHLFFQKLQYIKVLFFPFFTQLL